MLARTRGRERVVFFNKRDLGRAGLRRGARPPEREALCGSARDPAAVADAGRRAGRPGAGERVAGRQRTPTSMTARQAAAAHRGAARLLAAALRRAGPRATPPISAWRDLVGAIGGAGRADGPRTPARRCSTGCSRASASGSERRRVALRWPEAVVEPRQLGRERRGRSSSAAATPGRGGARRGAAGVETLLVTGDPAQICTLACNPSIGGQREGPTGARDRRAGRRDGAASIDAAAAARALPERKQRPVGAGAARAGRQSRPTRARGRRLRAQPNLTIVAGHGRGAGRRGRARPRRASRRTAARCSRGAVVLATGTFLGGKTFRGDVGAAGAASARRRRSGLPPRCARSAFRAAASRPGTPPRVDRATVDYARDGASSRPAPIRCRFRIAAKPRFAGPATPLLHHQDERANARAGAREPASLAALRARFDPRHRSALLPVDRRQGRQVRAQSVPLDLHRARRLGRPTRCTSAASRRRFPRRCNSRCCTRCPGLEDVRDVAGRLCRRIRFRSADRIARDARNASRRRALSLRTTQRHVGLRRGRGARVSSPGSTRRARAQGRAAACWAQRRVHRRADRRFGDARASTNRIGC